MSPIIKKLIVIVFGSTRRFIVGFGGMAVMVVTTVCGAVIALALPLDHGNYMFLPHMFYGAVIGAAVGVSIWGLLGYMVCRDKNAAPNGVIPDDSTT